MSHPELPELPLNKTLTDGTEAIISYDHYGRVTMYIRSEDKKWIDILGPFLSDIDALNAVIREYPGCYFNPNSRRKSGPR